jgi:hypothetical protein
VVPEWHSRIVSEDRDALRAGDVDREYVAEQLRNALNEGRLTLTEYDDRLQEAYAARTYGDLKGLLSDLPTVAPAGRSQVVPARPMLPSESTSTQIPAPEGNLTVAYLAHEWGDWFKLSIILTGIWFLTGHGYFWPMWVIGFIGLAKIGQTVNGLATGEPRKRYERQQRKAIERERRRAEERARRHDGRSDRDN